MTLGSVVVPARDEEAVITACLETLAPAAGDGRLDVVVVCNGCADGTAAVARTVPGVRVLELRTGSKPAALRAGDAATDVLPRLYLDADVVLPLRSALAVLARLSTRDGPLAARPPLRYDATGSVALVRRYYRARTRIPAVLGALWGAGVYGLSAQGRSRFAAFPDQVADDLWVDQLFAPHEVEIVDCEPVTVTAPRQVRDLLAILRRTYRGKAEHHGTNAETARETAPTTARDVGRLARAGAGGLVDAAAYTGFAVAARVAYRLPRQRSVAWERAAR